MILGTLGQIGASALTGGLGEGFGGLLLTPGPSEIDIVELQLQANLSVEMDLELRPHRAGSYYPSYSYQGFANGHGALGEFAGDASGRTIFGDAYGAHI